jgi:protein-S-isoprenylcysteine O-methyltransferase Ste14
MSSKTWPGLRGSVAVAISVTWGVTLGGTFGCLLPYLLGDWRLHQPLPFWVVARVAGGILIAVGLVPIASSFAAFVQARGTPVPVASPPRLVVQGFYGYVRNPI